MPKAKLVIRSYYQMGLIQKIFGTHSENELKRIYPIVDAVEALEPEMQKLSDSELKDKTREFKKRIAEGETLDGILPEAYAVVREASVRVLGLRHFRVQIIGGIILHQGRIAEMRTGEGKTLVSTLPAYLNALTGEGVNVVTVNDYLAKRDAEWMGQVHEFLGLTVGVVLNSMDNDERRAAYNCDITYVTNINSGFIGIGNAYNSGVREEGRSAQGGRKHSKCGSGRSGCRRQPEGRGGLYDRNSPDAE